MKTTIIAAAFLLMGTFAMAQSSSATVSADAPKVTSTESAPAGKACCAKTAEKSCCSSASASTSKSCHDGSKDAGKAKRNNKSEAAATTPKQD